MDQRASQSSCYTKLVFAGDQPKEKSRVAALRVTTNYCSLEIRLLSQADFVRLCVRVCEHVTRAARWARALALRINAILSTRGAERNIIRLLARTISGASCTMPGTNWQHLADTNSHQLFVSKWFSRAGRSRRIRRPARGGRRFWGEAEALAGESFRKPSRKSNEFHAKSSNCKRACSRSE